MRMLVPALALLALPALASADDVWRWTDADGTRCYSNLRELAPDDATTVDTRIVVEAKRLPTREPALVMSGGEVVDAGQRHAKAASQEIETPRIYTEERLRFGCYAASVLFSGGFSHPDDITVVGNCLPYLLGPEAWLNAARAELGLRASGINMRDVVKMYVERTE